MKKIDYQTYEKPSDFVKFSQGDTRLRIISSGGIAKKHGLKTAKGFVPLGDCTEDSSCKHCLQGNEAKTKWMWIALVRDTKQVKLLDVGPQIGDAICKIAKERKQDPKEFDVIINRVGEGRSTKYLVRGDIAKPTTPEELSDSKAALTFLIKKYFTKEDNNG